MNTQLMDQAAAKILIVDDTAANLRLLTGILKTAGYIVRQLRNGKMVMSSVLNDPPDLILLDILMPEMDGYEVCEQLKAEDQTRDIPIIFISALGGSTDKVQAFSSGGVDYVTKPFHVQEVLARVKTHLALQKTQDELQRKNNQLKDTLQEKEILMQEIVHRTKTNMTSIQSMLYLQSTRTTDEQVLQMFENTQNRVRSMALVQNKLYQSKDFTNLDLKEYLADLAATIFNNRQLDQGNVSLSFDLEAVIVSPDTTISCGLILNELLTNALKYAFPAKRSGEIKISLHPTTKDQVELKISDDGVGLPSDFDPRNTDSLGVELAIMVAEGQLKGSIDWQNETGTVWRIVF